MANIGSHSGSATDNAPSNSLQSAVGKEIGWSIGSVLFSEGTVGSCIVGATDGSVARVIELAVRHTNAAKEGPDVLVTPIQNGVDPHKRWPIPCRRREVTLTRCIGVTPAHAFSILETQSRMTFWCQESLP